MIDKDFIKHEGEQYIKLKSIEGLLREMQTSKKLYEKRIQELNTREEIITQREYRIHTLIERENLLQTRVEELTEQLHFIQEKTRYSKFSSPESENDPVIEHDLDKLIKWYQTELEEKDKEIIKLQEKLAKKK